MKVQDMDCVEVLTELQAIRHNARIYFKNLAKKQGVAADFYEGVADEIIASTSTIETEIKAAMKRAKT